MIARAIHFLLSPKGRTRRLPFAVMAVLTFALPTFIGHSLPYLIVDGLAVYVAQSLVGVVNLLVLWPLFVVTVRRLHDRNWRWMPAIICFLPLLLAVIMVTLGRSVPSDTWTASLTFKALSLTRTIVLAAIGFFLLILACLSSTKGRNRYGPDPHHPETVAVDVF